MQILFSTGSDPRYMLPPILGDRQINCGPVWSDATDAAGRFAALHTPAGEYDLARVAARLPGDQQPDAVVCLVDASWRNLPRNLAGFRCPRILLVADTHHLDSPLIGMLRYLAAEPYDRIVLLYDRHHLEIFRAAGFRNLYWFPGLTFPHEDAAVKEARSARRESRVGFVGQSGKIHPRRARLLGELAAGGAPVVMRPLPQREALGFYGQSLLGFNASLNGDLNLRVFEIMAAGAGLLTDRLAPESGLADLLAEGCEFAAYGSAAELVERARHYLAHPAEARSLGLAGAAWFDAHLNASRRRRLFGELVFDGVAPAEFALPPAESTRVYFNGDTDRLLAATLVYECVQELHRTQENVRVGLDPSDSPEDFAHLCATLPRVEFTTDPAAAAIDLAVLGRAGGAAFPSGSAARLWFWDAPPAGDDALRQNLLAAGFSPAGGDVALFCRSEAAPVAPPDALARARADLQRGDLNAALAGARAVLAQQPRSADARVLLAEIALRGKRAELAEMLCREALQLRPDDPGAETLLGAALGEQQKGPEAERVLGGLLARVPHYLPALLTLSRLLMAGGRFERAETVLRDAVRHHPDATSAAQMLGGVLKRKGNRVEALAWQRRALGERAPVPLVDPHERPVRVAFLVQHPQGWTSLQSVWSAFAGDPAFAVTVIAAPYQHPYPPEGGPEAIYEFLAAQGVPFVRWDRFEFAPEFADVLFVQNPYDVTRPPALRTPELLKRVARLAYVPYGLEIGGGGVNAQNQFNLPLQQVAWAVFARSSRHKEMFLRHCAAGDGHVEVTGHPRLDTLRALPAAPIDPEFARLTRGGRRLVFWNPQFDVRPDGSGYSTFLLWQEFLLEEFARRRDLAFVIRPHPLFFGTLEKRRIWNADTVAGFLRRVGRADNVVIDRRASYLPVFAASSAMLSDASTFLLEYAATGKPLLYLHNPRGPQLNSDGEFIRQHGYTAERREEIAAFLDLVAAGADPRAEARRAAYAEVMHFPAEGVAETIKRTVRARLSAEAGRGEPVDVRRN